MKQTQCKDIEPNHSENALRESEAKMRSIMDNIGIGVAIISPDMEVLEVNQQIRNWFPDIDINRHPICYQIFNYPEYETACDYCPSEKTLLDGLAHEATAQRMRGSETRDYRIISSPISNTKGKIIGAIELVEDITERISLESQLRQSQKIEAIGQLAGGVAHDFNNMLSVILGFTELSLEQVDPSQPLHAVLKQIHNAAIRSAEIVQQLLAFARKQTIAPKVLDLNNTVEGMLKILRRLIGEDIDLIWHPDSTLWLIKVDPTQIEQILVNLCTNARDAIAGVGKITIETENTVFDEDYCATHLNYIPGEYTMLVVSDNGCGMDKKILEKIFEPFFTTKSKDQGTGLGLSTVYGIIKQNNGFINVYSEQGNGTTFKIYLPRYTGRNVDVYKESKKKLPPSHGETILVVEDEPVILDMVKTILEKYGYRILTANTPSEAIRMAKENTDEIRLIITDVILPEMIGRDLINQINKTRPALKCLYMSGYTSDVIAHRGMLEDGVNFIQKPFSPYPLVLKVHEVLDS